MDNSCETEARTEAIGLALAQWPGISLTTAQLHAELCAHGWAEELPRHVGGLALCSACSRGCEVACGILDKEHLSQLRPTIAQVSNRADFVDEVMQQVRAKLLSGDRPRIKSYTGRGPLMAWLRMVARRVALDLVQAAKPGAEPPVDWVERLQAVQPTVETQTLQSRYAPVFKQALSEVLQTLPLEERSMLRLQLVENLPVRAIADMYGLHLATLYRRLERCHKGILSAVRMRLREALGPVSQSEIQSLIGAMEAEIGLSLTRLLKRDSDQ